MFAIFKKYRHLLSRRAADDFNRMAAFLTNFCGDPSVDLHRPDNPTAENPPSIRVNEDWLDEKLKDKGSDTAPKDIATSASAGTSEEFSRSDHVHKVADNGATKTSLSSGYDATGGTWTRNTTVWRRGVTKSNNVLCGGSMMFLTRMKQRNSPAGYAQLGWRTVTWDQNGCIISVAAEAANESLVVTSIE